MARMKYSPSNRRKPFNPSQLSTQGIVELRRQSDRRIQGMEQNFAAEKEQQQRERDALKENAELETNRIETDRKIQVENLKNKQIAMSQQFDVDAQQAKYDAAAGEAVFDSLAGLSKTLSDTALARTEKMEKDQTREGMTADIEDLKVQSREAYANLYKGSEVADVDILENASETNEALYKTLRAIAAQPGRGAIQERVILNRLYDDLHATETSKAFGGNERIYKDAQGRSFSGTDALFDPDRTSIVLATVGKDIRKHLGVEHVAPSFFDIADEAIAKRNGAYNQRSVGRAENKAIENTLTQAETLMSSPKAEDIASGAVAIAHVKGNATAHEKLRTKTADPTVDLETMSRAVALFDGVDMEEYHKDPKKYSLNNPKHKRATQYEPFLKKREDNRLAAYVANKKLKRIAMSEEVDQNREEFIQYVKDNPGVAELNLETAAQERNINLPENAKYLIKYSLAERETEDRAKLKFEITNATLTPTYINENIKHPTVKKEAIEAHKAQEKRKFGPDYLVIQPGLKSFAKEVAKQGGSRDMGPQARLIESSITVWLQDYIKKNGEGSAKAGMQELERLYYDAKKERDSPNADPLNLFYSKTDKYNNIQYPNIQDPEYDSGDWRTTLLSAAKKSGANVYDYAYTVETQKETDRTLASVNILGGAPIFSDHLRAVVDMLNKSNPDQKRLTYTEFFNTMQEAKTKISGKYHPPLVINANTEIADILSPQDSKTYAKAKELVNFPAMRRVTANTTSPFDNGQMLMNSTRRSMPGGDPMQPLQDLVLSGEGGFTSANRGMAGDSPGGIPDLDRKTVGEWKQLYSQGWNALGGPQFIESTFNGAVNRLKLSDDTVMSGDVQMELFNELILGGVKRPRLSAYLNGTSDDIEGALEDMSLEFASVANPKTGITSYPNVGGNAASINSNSMALVLQQLRNRLN